MPRKIRKRRQSLWIKSNKKCYWCGCDTVFPNPGADNSPKANNLATIEHLRSRFREDRYEPNHTNEQRLVLACLECNNLRSKLETKVEFDLTVNEFCEKQNSQA